jgi:hypothetical protein
VAFEAKTHRLRLEALSRGPLSGNLKNFWIPALRLGTRDAFAT